MYGTFSGTGLTCLGTFTYIWNGSLIDPRWIRQEAIPSCEACEDVFVNAVGNLIAINLETFECEWLTSVGADDGSLWSFQANVADVSCDPLELNFGAGSGTGDCAEANTGILFVTETPP